MWVRYFVHFMKKCHLTSQHHTLTSNSTHRIITLFSSSRHHNSVANSFFLSVLSPFNATFNPSSSMIIRFELSFASVNGASAKTS